MDTIFEYLQSVYQRAAEEWSRNPSRPKYFGEKPWGGGGRGKGKGGEKGKKEKKAACQLLLSSLRSFSLLPIQLSIVNAYRRDQLSRSDSKGREKKEWKEKGKRKRGKEKKKIISLTPQLFLLP